MEAIPAAIEVWAERVPDIFDEVNEDLRADQARSLLQRYGGLLILAMLATLAAVGGYTWWQERQHAAADAVAMQFLAAQKAAEARVPPKDLPQRFASIAANAPTGYKTLALLHLAAMDWDAGRHDKAITEWHNIANDAAVPEVMRNLATITSVQHQVDSGDATKLKAEMLPIIDSASGFRPLAIQINALLDLRLGRSKEAAALMQSLLNDPSTPQELRQLTQSIMVATGNDVPAAPPP